ncbi:MAG: hypothetical protein ACTSUS_08130, partial [Candidatus Freyarchaeota archaeon]
MSQPEIARRVGVSQASVSNEIRRLMKMAEESSLNVALTDYGDEELVEELRLLAVQLRKLNTKEEMLDQA